MDPENTVPTWTSAAPTVSCAGQEDTEIYCSSPGSSPTRPYPTGIVGGLPISKHTPIAPITLVASDAIRTTLKPI